MSGFSATRITNCLPNNILVNSDAKHVPWKYLIFRLGSKWTYIFFSVHMIQTIQWLQNMLLSQYFQQNTLLPFSYVQILMQQVDEGVHLKRLRATHSHIHNTVVVFYWNVDHRVDFNTQGRIQKRWVKHISRCHSCISAWRHRNACRIAGRLSIYSKMTKSFVDHNLIY